MRLLPLGDAMRLMGCDSRARRWEARSSPSPVLPSPRGPAALSAPEGRLQNDGSPLAARYSVRGYGGKFPFRACGLSDSAEITRPFSRSPLHCTDNHISWRLFAQRADPHGSSLSANSPPLAGRRYCLSCALSAADNGK
uniref:Uncharacterized protein n=1 Tax=Branchiostoma floridae TaxID=7739 RepID=C3ZIX3_BRAFL|eukprot:XP_002591478.1 hypothetical protein BRAFLDRAFT_105250 [Branchiostoma floridae]